VRSSVVHRCVIAVVIPLLLVLAAGCSSSKSDEVVGSSGTTTKEYDYSGFTAVHVDNDFSATVTRGEAFKVSVTVNENLAEYLKVAVEGDTLSIGLDQTVQYRLANLRADITLPSLSGMEVDGGSDAYVADFVSQGPLDLKVSGAGQVSLGGVRYGAATFTVSGASLLDGTLQAKEVIADVSGAAKVSLNGTAPWGKLSASGASKLLMNNFALRKAEVKLSGASQASVRVNGTLAADLSGASRLDYYGTAKLGTVSVNDASQITHVQD